MRREPWSRLAGVIGAGGAGPGGTAPGRGSGHTRVRVSRGWVLGGMLCEYIPGFYPELALCVV